MDIIKTIIKYKMHTIITYIKYKLGYINIVKEYCEFNEIPVKYIIDSKYLKIEEFRLGLCAMHVFNSLYSIEQNIKRYNLKKYVGSWVDIEKQELVTDETTINLLNMML